MESQEIDSGLPGIKFLARLKSVAGKMTDTQPEFHFVIQVDVVQGGEKADEVTPVGNFTAVFQTLESVITVTEHLQTAAETYVKGLMVRAYFEGMADLEAHWEIPFDASVLNPGQPGLKTVSREELLRRIVSLAGSRHDLII